MEKNAAHKSNLLARLSEQLRQTARTGRSASKHQTRPPLKIPPESFLYALGHFPKMFSPTNLIEQRTRMGGRTYNLSVHRKIITDPNFSWHTGLLNLTIFVITPFNECLLT